MSLVVVGVGVDPSAVVHRGADVGAEGGADVRAEDDHPSNIYHTITRDNKGRSGCVREGRVVRCRRCLSEQSVP